MDYLTPQKSMLNETKFLELYHRHRESGLTITDFCKNEGIAESTFYYWRKKLEDKRRPKDFIPLVVKPPTTLSVQSKNSTPEPGNTIASDDSKLLEVVYPNGTRLRLKSDIDLASLRALICLFD